MRVLLLAACLVPGLWGAGQDATEIVRRAVEADIRNDEAARNYTYIEREEQRTRDDSGSIRERKSETWDVTLLEGSPFRRLLARNDEPLPPADVKKEEERLRESNKQRRAETEEQRQQRIADWNRKRNRQREQLRELPHAFHFRITSESKINGYDVWVIDGTPVKDYKPKTSLARRLLPKLACRFWISKTDYRWIKLELETLDTVSLGLFIVRLGKGSRAEMEQVRVGDDVWMPKHITVFANARVMLVKGMRVDTQWDFSNFKKFQVESRLMD